ncbi:MAG: MBL fold metallo-hydrolase [Bacteroidales bacterium]|nr:MBL fold metallo-hydrolase [Bacteroidales bacterium]
MNITFLGTGTSQGVPVIACQCDVCKSTDPRDQRLRSSIMIVWENKRIVIDCGPDFRQQMLRENVRSIDAILVTHSHKDHLGGLDDVRAFNYILKKPVPVFATDEVQEEIRLEYRYAFEGNRYPGVPEIELHSFTNKPFHIEDTEIIPIKAVHYQDDQFVFGFRIGDLTYLTDVYRISDEEKEKIKGSRIVIVNALRKRKHYSHMNLDEAVTLLGELNPQKGFLTHISHQMGRHSDVEKELPENIFLAWDRMSVELT